MDVSRKQNGSGDKYLRYCGWINLGMRPNPRQALELHQWPPLILRWCTGSGYFTYV